MDVFTMVVIIVAVTCLADVANKYLKNKRAEAAEELPDEVLNELDDLRARVEVLEKIVTDDRYHLNKELDRLERQV